MTTLERKVANRNEREAIKNYIVANYKAYTAQEIADHFKVSLQKIAYHKGVLSKEGLIEGKKKVKKKIKAVVADYIQEESFKNITGDGKKEARQYMALGVEGNKATNKPILTLPHKEWSLEKLIQMYTGKKFSFLAVERELDTFIEMVKHSKLYGKNNTCYHGDMGDKIYEAKEDTFSHAMLDYCGTFSMFRKEITTAVINNIVEVGGTIAVTLVKARDNSDILNNCNDASGLGKSKTENGLKMFFKSLCLISDFEVVTELAYTDSMPMMLVILKRTK